MKLCLKKHCGNYGLLEAYIAGKSIPLDWKLEPWSKTLQSHSYENFYKKSQKNEGDLQLCEAQRAGYEVVV